ncbi:MAG: class II aldolase/adducin family protein [Pseudomonadota bacterium]
MATQPQLTASVKDQVSEEEWAQRCDLAVAYRLVAHFGWDDLIFTHLSARVPGPDAHFLINPFGLMFEEITASSLVKVDLKGNLVMPSEYFINPAGFIIHSAVHAAREDAHCVLHTHSVAGVAVSAQKKGLLPISQIALNIFNDVAYHDYEGIALNPEEKERLIAHMGARNTLILRNHGLLTAGGSVAEAFVRLFFIQKACEIQIAAQAGGEVEHLSQDMCDLVARQSAGGFAGVAPMSWAPLKRKVERLYPDYSF